MSPTLDPFQHEVIDFFNANGGRGIYADPVGARKTGTTLSWLADNADLKRTLCVAPKAVHNHWRREAAKFYPELVVLHGKTKGQRHDAIESVRDGSYDLGRCMYVTSYESMKEDEERLIRARFDMVVFDEGHKLKGRRTDVALCANKVTLKPDCLIVATGTPVLNNADELWQYLHMLDRKKYPSFDRWVRTHFEVEDTDFHGKLPRKVRLVGSIKPGHEKLLRKQLAGVMIQRQIHELFPGELWTQPVEHEVISVDLNAAERKGYDKLVKHGWADIGNEYVATGNKLALWTRLRQLGSDWGNLDASLPGGSKVMAATERIADLARRESVVAFAGYRQTCTKLVEQLTKKKLRAFPYTGAQSEDEHEHLLAEHEAGNVDVVVGTIGALGTGVDGLQRHGSSIVMLDRDWAPAINDQCFGRRRRSGQTERVSVRHIVAEGTLDIAVMQACLDKTNVTEILADRPLLDGIYGRDFTL